MNEELLHEVKSLLPWILAAGIAVAGYYGVKNHRAAAKAAASDAVANAYTVEELEEAVAKFGGKASGGVLKLRLAKKQFDAGRYQEAFDAYVALEKEPPSGFEEIPVVGRAQCLEALGKYAEAEKAFADFAAEHPESFLALTAKLGAARAKALGGKKAEALKDLDALKASVKGDAMATARVEAAEDCVKRLGK